MHPSHPNAFASFAAALVLACAACSSPGALPSDPTDAFESLEERLLAAPVVQSESLLVAEGALSAKLRSVHTVTDEGEITVVATGTFGGKPIDLRFVSDGQRMTVTTPEGTRQRELPPDLRGGLLLGLTRMGWMHNVAMVAAGGWPDATDGHVDAFTRAVNVLGGERLEEDGRERRALTFGVEVRGSIGATAVLWLDCETGLPIERWQRVQLPQGEMHVVETYEMFRLEAGSKTSAGAAGG